MLRASEARDRSTFIELLASPEAHLPRWPRSSDELECELPEVPARWRGSFVVDLDRAIIGRVPLWRATEHRRPAARGKGRSRLPVPAACLGFRVRHRDVRGGARLVRRCPSRRAGGCSPPSPPTSTRCASRQSWGSPRWNGSTPGTPSSGSACGPRLSRRPEPVVGGQPVGPIRLARSTKDRQDAASTSNASNGRSSSVAASALARLTSSSAMTEV